MPRHTRKVSLSAKWTETVIKCLLCTKRYAGLFLKTLRLEETIYKWTVFRSWSWSGVLSLAFRLLLIFGSFFFILCCSHHCSWRWNRRQFCPFKDWSRRQPRGEPATLECLVTLHSMLEPRSWRLPPARRFSRWISWPGISGFVSGPHHPEHSRVCGPFRTGHKPGQLHRASSSVHDIDPALLSVLPGKGGGTELGIQRGNWGSTKMLL